MTRAIALLVFAALVAALFLTDAPPATRLAAAEVGRVLHEEAAGAAPGEGAASEPRTLLDVLLASPAVETLPERSADGRERVRLKLGGSNLHSDEPVAWDPMWPAHVRESVLRTLRAHFEEEGIALDVEGLKSPVADGVHFDARLSLAERRLELEMRVGDGPPATAAGPWRSIDQLSLLPPLIAIFLAILFRRPVAALFAGVWAGAALVEHLEGASPLAAVRDGALATFTTYLKGQIQDHGKLQIILFVVFMLAMIGVITRGGGIKGVMERLARLARDARRSQVAAWLMGLVVFFDDYANTILVGTTMRPLTDKFRVAREKLAYIVDSTAAPVAGISILSTWIAFEVSTFAPSLPDAALSSSQGYAVFLQTLPYRFYCIFTIVFVGMVVLSGRDFGPMLTAERRASAGQVLRDGATPMVGKAATRLAAEPGVAVRPSTALVPLGLFVATVLGWILWRGGAFDMRLADLFTMQGAVGVIGRGSGNEPLMWGSIVGFTAALILAHRAGLRVSLALASALDSIRAMAVAVVILYLAWSLGKVCSDLGTATFLSVSLGDSLPWMILPAVLFALSGMIAFSTGSSWSTMTILLPLVVGLAYRLGFDSVDAAAGLEAQRAAGHMLLVITIGAVLEGAIFGDHCSPISDTTVMSSIASASDHIDHVRTQAPYAVLTMIVALVVGYFPATFLGLNPFICIALGLAVLWTFLRVYGKKSAFTAEPAARHA